VGNPRPSPATHRRVTVRRRSWRARACGHVKLRAVLPVVLAALCLGTPSAATAARPFPCELRGNPTTPQNEGPTDFRQFLRSRGTVRAKMWFVDFPDAPGGTESTRDLATQLVPAAKRALARASYGRMKLSVSVRYGWLRMRRPSTEYGFSDTGVSYENHEAYIRDAVALADPDVDFDGVELVYIVSSAQAAIPLSPAFLGGPGSDVFADGTRIGFGATFGRDIRSQPGSAYGAHVLEHETSHTFGLPDLYYGSGDFASMHAAVGAWDIMGWIGPGFGYTAWHLHKLRWLADTQLLCRAEPGTVIATLKPLTTRGGLKAIVVRVSPSVAYVVENRERIGLDKGIGRNKGICSTGALVTRVDAKAAPGEIPIRVIPAVLGADTACGPLAFAAFSREQLSIGDDGITVTADAIRKDRSLKVHVRWGRALPP